MEGASHGLDALIKFSTEHREKWSEHVGKKQLLDVANSEWNRINQSHGWVARIQHAFNRWCLRCMTPGSSRICWQRTNCTQGRC